MDEATDHPVLKVMPEMTEVQKKFATMSVALLNYEEEIKNVWMNHNVSFISYHFTKVFHFVITLNLFVG